MPRSCSVCSSPDRAQIDRQLVAGVPYRNIAERSGMSLGALFRHRGEHLTEQLAAAAEQRQAAEPEPAPAPPAEPPEQTRRQVAAEVLDIVGQLKAINGSALEVLQSARRAGDGRLVLLAVDRVQKQIELQARLIGQIDERPTINIWLSAEWQVIEQALLDTLSRHPQARYEVSERLNALRAV